MASIKLVSSSYLTYFIIYQYTGTLLSSTFSPTCMRQTDQAGQSDFSCQVAELASTLPLIERLVLKAHLKDRLIYQQLYFHVLKLISETFFLLNYMNQTHFFCICYVKIKQFIFRNLKIKQFIFRKTEKQTIYFQKTEKQTFFSKKTGMGVVIIYWSATKHVVLIITSSHKTSTKFTRKSCFVIKDIL